MVPSNLKVLAKFGLCSNCLQKLDECSLARARKIFASARILGFSLKIPCRVAYAKFASWKQKLTLETMFPVWETENIGETCAPHECFWKNASSFC